MASNTNGEPSLAQVIIDLILNHFKQGRAPIRKELVDTIKLRHPRLRNPRLDLQVARALNLLVEDELLERKGGKFYHPGKRCYEPS